MKQKTDLNARKSIIEASTRLFAQRGYHGTSVAQIAEATGLTKGALYWYFRGKEDLFLSVLDTIREKWHEGILSKVEAVAGAANKLERLFDATSAMVGSNENPLSMYLFLVAAGAQPEMRDFEEAIQSVYQGYVKTIAGIIRKGQEEGEIKRDVDAESAAVGIIGCLEGVVLQARLHPPARIATSISEMKRHFVRSLCGVPSRPVKKEKVLHETPADQLSLF